MGGLNIEGGLRSPPCAPCPVFSSNINHHQGAQVGTYLVGWEAGDCQLDGSISRALKFRLTWPTRAVPESFSCPVVSGRAAAASPKMCEVHAEGSIVPI